jgi:hypothetical protein
VLWLLFGLNDELEGDKHSLRRRSAGLSVGLSRRAGLDAGRRVGLIRAGLGADLSAGRNLRADLWRGESV